MNLEVLKTIGGPRVQRLAYRISRHAPEILTGIGITGVIGGTVLIARASTKLEDHFDEFEARKRLIDLKRNETNSQNEALHTEEEIQRDLVHLYVWNAIELGKLFGPGVTLELASIASILAGFGVMQKRAASLLGAYKAVETAFNEYRKRVTAEYGEAKELEIYRGFVTEKVEDAETGKKKSVKKLDPNAQSMYTRVFDEFNTNWRTIDGYNEAFLRNEQNWANDRLHAQGYLFLNDVFDRLGFKRMPYGQTVGWLVGPDGGDQFVDFGIWNLDSGEMTRAFINGEEKSVWLNFNVDGVIVDKI